MLKRMTNDIERNHIEPTAPPAPYSKAPSEIETAKKALAAADYNGEKVVLIAATDIPITHAQSQVTEQLPRRFKLACRTCEGGTVHYRVSPVCWLRRAKS
jgi:hypothetical protein